jgi:hypothetical protein
VKRLNYQINDLLEMNRNSSTIHIVAIGGVMNELRNFVKSQLENYIVQLGTKKKMSETISETASPNENKSEV